MPRGGRPLVTAKWMPASCSSCTASIGARRQLLLRRDERAVDVGEQELDHFIAPVAADERVRRGVVRELGLRLARELRDDPLRERLAELDAPLVEGVDAPDRALHEDAVLVEGDERAERVWRQLLGQEDVRRAVPLEDPMRHDRLGRSLRAYLLVGLPERKRLGLGEHVRHEDVVVVAERVERLREADEVDRDELRPLVDQLVEAVLAVRPGLAPEDRARLVVDARPSSVTCFPFDSIVSCWR